MDVFAHRIHCVLYVNGSPLVFGGLETLKESAHAQDVFLGEHRRGAASSPSSFHIDSPFPKTALNQLINDESGRAKKESERREELHVYDDSRAELSTDSASGSDSNSIKLVEREREREREKVKDEEVGDAESAK